jgi:tripartite-type tricarboxylate transporter receptor subunit TctC
MHKYLFLFLIFAATGAWAADYPTRPIRMVVAYAPGGTTDFTARVTAPKLTELLGQTVVVDNRPGAGSILGTDVVAKGSPDGYTLLMADTTYGIIPAIYAKLPFNVQKDFATISQIMSVPNALVVHPSVAARSVKELV